MMPEENMLISFGKKLLFKTQTQYNMRYVNLTGDD